MTCHWLAVGIEAVSVRAKPRRLCSDTDSFNANGESVHRNWLSCGRVCSWTYWYDWVTVCSLNSGVGDARTWNVKKDVCVSGLEADGERFSLFRISISLPRVKDPVPSHGFCGRKHHVYLLTYSQRGACPGLWGKLLTVNLSGEWECQWPGALHWLSQWVAGQRPWYSRYNSGAAVWKPSVSQSTEVAVLGSRP